MFYSIPLSFHFRLLTDADWMHVCRWLGKQASQSEYWQWKMFRMLARNTMGSGVPFRKNSWMAVADRKRLFLVEIASDEVFLTAPIPVLQNYNNAWLIWSAVVYHLHQTQRRNEFFTNLPPERHIEFLVLQELGFSCHRTNNGFLCQFLP